MRMLIAAIAFVTSTMPAFAGSTGCDRDSRASISCAEGQVWDSATGSCITQSS